MHVDTEVSRPRHAKDRMACAGLPRLSEMRHADLARIGKPHSRRFTAHLLKDFVGVTHARMSINNGPSVLPQLLRQLLGLDVRVPLEHGQALVPRHAGHFHDAQSLLEQA